MAITIKCPDCGHTAESKDGATKTCPECEGTMAAPPKKKYQAKATSLEDEERARTKSKSRDDDDEPKGKKEAMSLDDDEEDEKPKAKRSKPRGGTGSSTRDGAAAEALDLNPGFKNKELMDQVEAELDDGEVLHWAGRMCPELVTKTGMALRIAGFLFAGMGLLFCLIVLAVAPGVAKIGAVVPLVFVGIGVALALVMPGVMLKQATRGWYAVTDQRALVYRPSLFGSGGSVDTYEPKDLGRMRVKLSDSRSGAGDLVFKTKMGVVHTKNGSRKEEINYGFLGIDNVGEVETLVHKVLIGTDDD